MPFAFLSAAALAGAWLTPGTVLSAILGWGAALLYVFIVHKSIKRYRSLYISGVIANSIGFIWLIGTIKDFGGFPFIGAFAVFLLFTTLSSIQFLIFGFIFKFLPEGLERFALRSALAWTVAELISIRIFPWYLGHTQLAFTPFAQLASAGGVPLVSFVMIVISEALILRKATSLLIGSIAAVLSLSYGLSSMNAVRLAGGKEQRISIVQGNVTLEEKHNVKMFSVNTERYKEISNKIASPSTLLIWPETVIQEWIYDYVGNVERESQLPSLTTKAPMLVGSLSFSTRKDRHNSAIAILNDGTVLEPYHKRILMPFGEYVPFSRTFPFLRDVSGILEDFTPGKSASVFEYPLIGENGESYNLKVSPLICYEDIVPSLSQESVRKGAELLVNLTNDAWFGRSAAPYQHHLIASFRAIETGRYLVRATNTGFSGVIDPLGKTTAFIEPNTEATLTTGVKLISNLQTPYVRMGDLPWWILSGFTIIVVLISAVKRRFNRL